MVFYSSELFILAGVEDALLSTVLVFGLNVLMTMLSAGLIDKIGRKPLLLRGAIGVVCSLFLLGFVLVVMEVHYYST